MDTADSAAPQPPQANRNRLAMSIDLRWVVVILLLVIAAMLAAWRPWTDGSGAAGNASRTIKVSGQATVRAEPDEFVFSPQYTINNPDRQAGLADMARKSSEITGKLKALGLRDSQIKSNIDSYNREPLIYPEKPDNSATYTLQLTITVAKRDQAQQVQDYLATTSPTGNVTPQAAFSAAKRKQLESQARDEAVKEARAKAEQSAKNLGFRLGNVKSVDDGSGFGIMPFAERGIAADAGRPADAPATSIGVQPGQNELHYSVAVEYFVR